MVSRGEIKKKGRKEDKIERVKYRVIEYEKRVRSGEREVYD